MRSATLVMFGKKKDYQFKIYRKKKSETNKNSRP